MGYSGFFSGWDTSAIGTYMSNINPDTTKEVMCVLTSAASAVNFTTCNDVNYATLQAYTSSLRQTGAPLVQEGKQLNWMVTQGLLERGAVFAFASNERQSGQVLLSNLFNNTATVV